MLLRKYNRSDCQTMAQLFYDTVHTVNAKDYTQEQQNAWATGTVDLEAWNMSFTEHYTIVAVEEDIIVGFGDIDKSGYLDRLYVHKDYQKQGIATAICNELEHSVYGKRITTHASITAKQFFLSRGYEVINEQQVIRNGVALTNYIMEKKPDMEIKETMNYTIREIAAADNQAVEWLIRTCLIEFGANHEGTAWADPDLGRFSEIYATEGNCYWVAIDETGRVVGGVGIGKLSGVEDVCELQKMYCLPEARGTGIAHKLIETALTYAGKYYRRCYLETLENMVAAQRFYEKYGFSRIDKPLVETGHFACDVCYVKKL